MPNGQPFDVLKDKISGPKFADEAYEMGDEFVTRIIECSVTDETEALTWCASNDCGDVRLTNSGLRSDVVTVDVHYASADGRAIGKVELMGCAVDGIVLDGGTNLESRLLEAEAQAPSTSEQINHKGT
jgi:hypothetical protein